MKLFSRTEGTGVPVVLTSGLGDTCTAWSNLFECLRDTSRVLCWDLRGHGRSEASTEPGDYSAELGTADLLGMVGKAGGARGNPAILVGHSLGGYLSLRVALGNPELVKALVLIATGPGFRDEASRSEWNSYALKLDLGSEVNPIARHLGLQQDASVVEGLQAIRVPVLVIVGSEDRRFLAARDYLVRKLPDATAVSIEGGRHSIHKTHAEQVSRATCGFLQSRHLL